MFLKSQFTQITHLALCIQVCAAMLSQIVVIFFFFLVFSFFALQLQ